MASRGKYMVQLALLKRQAERNNSRSNKLCCPTEVHSVRANINTNVGEDRSNRDKTDTVKQNISTEVQSGQMNVRMDYCEDRNNRDESDVVNTSHTLPTPLSEFVCEFSSYSADNEPVNWNVPNALDIKELQFAKTIINKDKDENNNDTGQRSLSVINSVDEARLLCYESELSDDSTNSFDDDDDVRDPNWKPTKKDLVVSETESEEEDESDNKGNSKTEINILDIQSSSQTNPNDNFGRNIDEGTEGGRPEDTIDHEEIVESAECSRKRQRTADPQNWKRNVQKRLRMEGKEFLGIKKSSSGEYIERNRSSRILTDRGCSKRCKKTGKNRQCTLLSEEDRQCIFDGFWNNLDWQGKKVLVNSLVDCKPCPDSGNKRRKVSYVYHLKSGGIKVQVCKSMFLSTLGIGEKMAYGWLEDAEKNSGTPNKPKILSRGVPPEVRQSAHSFLDSLPKLPSHYCRSSSSKLYLESLFTSLAELYHVYQDYCKNNSTISASRKVFETVFHEKNLSIYRPRKDKCDICCAYEVGNADETVYNNHISKKREAREEKDADKEMAKGHPNIKVVTMDLEAVLLSPRLNASAIYYKTKLACHNFTIYDLATKDVAVYFWHEAEGDLCASSFASCLTHYIKQLPTDVTEIILYSDGCSYQNRNAILSNALLCLAKERNVTITQKYLTKGHTQMECDSVHSTVENMLRNKPVYSPFTYVEIMKAARPQQRYTVHYLTHDFFLDFTQLVYYSSIRPGTKTGDPVVTDVVCLKYSSNGTAQYKLKFSDEFKDLPRRVTRRSNQCAAGNPVWPRLHKGPLPIKGSKYQHLQELKAVIPNDFHGFYDSLQHTNG